MSKEKQAKEEIKVYMRRVKTLFPLFGRERKRFLNDLDESIERFASEGGDSSYDSIAERFGDPEEVVFNYIAAMDEEVLNKKISETRCVRILVIVAIIAIAICTGMSLYWGYDSYMQAINTIVVEGETIIC